MFHANAWGIPYTAILAGARVVMPGPDLTPDGLLRLMQDEKSPSARRADHLDGSAGKLDEYDLSSLKKVMCGGSAVPRSLFGVLARQARHGNHPGLGHDRDLARGLALDRAGRVGARRRGGPGRHPR
jgi:hypothetical protein